VTGCRAPPVTASWPGTVPARRHGCRALRSCPRLSPRNPRPARRGTAAPSCWHGSRQRPRCSSIRTPRGRRRSASSRRPLAWRGCRWVPGCWRPPGSRSVRAGPPPDATAGPGHQAGPRSRGLFPQPPVRSGEVSRSGWCGFVMAGRGQRSPVPSRGNGPVTVLLGVVCCGAGDGTAGACLETPPAASRHPDECPARPQEPRTAELRRATRTPPGAVRLPRSVEAEFRNTF